MPDDGTIDVFNVGLPAPKPAIFRFTPASGHVRREGDDKSGPLYRRHRSEVQWHIAAFKVMGSEFITATVPTGPGVT